MTDSRSHTRWHFRHALWCLLAVLPAMTTRAAAQMPTELAGMRMPRIQYAPRTYADIRQRSAMFDMEWAAQQAAAPNREADQAIAALGSNRQSGDDLNKALADLRGTNAEWLRGQIATEPERAALALRVVQARLAAPRADHAVQRVAFVCYDLKPLGRSEKRTHESYVDHEALIAANVNSDNLPAWESLLLNPVLTALPEADSVRVRFAAAAAMLSFARQQKQQVSAATVQVIDAALNDGARLEPSDPTIKERAYDRLISALEQIGTPAALGALVRACGHHSEAVRESAASAAARSPVPDKAAVLRSAAAATNNPLAREALQRAITAAERKPPGSEPARK